MKVSPSLLAADFMNLSEEVKRIKNSGCDYIHLDVMDGNFVPNISFGPSIISQLKQILDVPFDVHLMINNPRFYLNEFKKAGANYLTYHYEISDNHHELIKEIKDLGMRAGLSIKPNTKVEEIVPYLNDLDLVLVMSVEPGFGGQKFMDSCLEKIKFLSEYKKEHGLSYQIEVDGGINYETAKLVKNAGVEIVVAGTYLFKGDMVKLVKELQAL